MKRNEPMHEPLAIIGMSCLFPKAQTLREYWANICNGVDAITDIPDTHWRPEEYYDKDPKKPDFTYSKRGGFVPTIPFDPVEFGISPAALEATDVSQLMGLVVAQGALVDAGYGTDREFDRSRVSVVLGLTGTLQLVIPLGARLGHPIWRKALKDAGVDDAIAAEVMANIGEAYVPWQENSFPGLLGNVAAGRIANRLNLGGTNCIVDAACGSSLGAVHMAAMELQSGAADMVITGGVDMFNDIFMYMCFSKTPALSPSGDAKPFSTEADGTALGEGVGMVILKRLSKAKADGDKIYAVLTGLGTSSDGRGKSIYAPSDEGQEKALRRAYEEAGISPDTVGMIEAHGTGTKVGDEIELKALRRVYGDAPEGRPWCGIGSVKSMIGHTKAAAGSAGLIKAALALHHKTLPPTIKVREAAPVFKDSKTPFYLLLEKRPWFNSAQHPRRAAVSAFGFGGSNYHAVLEEYETSRHEIDWDGRTEIIALSGTTPAAIRTALAPFTKPLAPADLRLQAAHSRHEFQAVHPCRLVFAIEHGKTDLSALAAAADAKLAATPAPARFALPEGAWYETGAAAEPIGVVFPGQGAQYLGMGRDLCCLMPETFTPIAAADALLGELAAGKRLADLVYPPQALEEAGRKIQEEALKATGIAQPAIGAVSIGAYRALERFGIKPAALIGHSFGELTALCAAGVYDEATLFRLARRRGELMGAGSGDRGGMIAVSQTAAEAAELLATEKLDLVIANYNAPTQMVLSGSTNEIQRAAEIFRQRKVRATVLPVAGAFHSRFVADAAVPFRAAVGEVMLRAPELPVYANTTGTPYPSDTAAIADLLGNQLANPVKFIDGIEAMYASGIRTFLEVAPGAKMSGLVKAIIGDRPFTSIGLDASGGKKPGSLDLARTLALCAALGHSVRLTLWEDGEETIERAAKARKPVMTIPLSGANYRSPRPPRAKKVLPARPAVSPAAPAPALAPVSAPAAASPRPAAPVPTSPAPALSQPAVRQAPAASAPVVRETVMTDGTGISPALARNMIGTLQQMQIQTAELHRKFLEGQEQAQKTIQLMLEGRMGAPTTHPVVAPVHSPAQTFRAEPLPAARPAPAQQAVPAAAPSPVVKTAPEPVRPAPAPAIAAAPVAPRPAAPTADIIPAILQIVSEKTGYPAEMLNIDMDMESDLGIDSIKRVEIMSGVQEKLPSAPVIQPDQLGKLRTLRQIIEFIGAQPADAAARAATAILPAQTAPQSLSAPAVSVANDIVPVILQIVSEKTGYPAEMLNIDMDMESDLGIDSIKRVEIMSGVQEKLPNAPVIQPDQLGKLRTLRQIIEFIGAQPAAAAPQAAMPATVPVIAAPVAPAATGAAASISNDIIPVILRIVSDKTGYPAEMLNLDMDMESDLGIDSIKRVEIMSGVQEQLPNAPVVQPDQLGKLRTLRQIIEFISARPAAAAPQAAMPAAVATVAAPAVPVVSSPAASISSDVVPVILQIVSEKTGYPAEMLNLDMDMESDLGIDSIKRVEIMSGVQEKLPNAPVIQPDQLGKLRTLHQIIEFLQGGQTAQAAIEVPPSTTQPAQAAAPAPVTAVTSDLLRRTVVEAVAQPTAETRPQVQLPAGTTVLITDDGTPLAQLLAVQIAARGVKTEIVDIATPLNPALATHVSGLVLLAPPPAKAENSRWTEASEQFVKRAFFLVQAAEASLQAHAGKGGALLATVSRLDGAFGLIRPDAAIDPIQGALAGLAKTAAREWPSVAAKAIDLDVTLPADGATAKLLGDEVFARGPIEAGVTAEARYSLVETEEPIRPRPDAKPLWGQNDVVIVTGGARGVTAAVAVEVARAGGPTLVLLGRSPEPQPEPAWLTGLSTDSEIKRALMMHAGGRKLTPKELEKQYQHVMANREILRTLDAIKAAGGRFLYRSVDVRSPEAVPVCIAEIQRTAGRITGLIHGAGVLRDRRIAEKTRDQFDDVFDTKVVGLRNVLNSLMGEQLKGFVVFSSVTGRYGRIGQVDYAMANEALNKVAQQWALMHPDCRTVACNWGPWHGGMVNDGLRKLFLEEGVGLIPLEAGARHLLAELSNASDHQIEVVIIGMEGLTGHPDSVSASTATGSTQQPAGGAIPAVAQSTVEVRLAMPQSGSKQNTATPAVLTTTAPSVSKPATAELYSAPAEHTAGEAPAALRKKFIPAFERQISLEKDRYLAAHILNGDPVLPMALTAEWLAHGALHENPGFLFHGFEDLRILKGFVLTGAIAQTLRVHVTKVRGMDEFPTVSAELRSGSHGKETVHARAEIVLAEKLPDAPAPALDPDLSSPYPLSTGDIYRHELFHGRMLEGITGVVGWSQNGIACRTTAAPSPDHWISAPPRPAWLTDPLVLDSAYQLMILWTRRVAGAPSLPSFAARYRQYRPAFPADGARIVISASRSGAMMAKAAIEFLDHDGRLIARMDGYECVINPALEEAFRRRSLEGAANA